MTEETAPEAAAPAPQQAMALSPAREAAQIDRQRAMAETTFGRGINPFSNGDAFKLALNIAEFISKSTFIPEAYQGNPANVMVAMDYASRLPGNTSAIMLMQNMDVVKGRPGLRGTFYAGLVNSSPLFGRLRYEWRGTDNPGGEPSLDFGCRAYATDRETGDTLYGAWIDWRMVKGEGWSKNDKWNYMREQMFLYRATSFFARVYASDVTLGLYETEELRDAIPGDYTVVTETRAEKLEAKLAEAAPIEAAIAGAGPGPITDAPAPEQATTTKGTRRAQKVKAEDPPPATDPAPVECDGNHGGPECDAPECWQASARRADEAEAARQDAEREASIEPAASNLFDAE